MQVLVLKNLLYLFLVFKSSFNTILCNLKYVSMLINFFLYLCNLVIKFKFVYAYLFVNLHNISFIL